MFDWRKALVLTIVIGISAFSLDAAGPATQPDAGTTGGLSVRIAVPEPDIPPLRSDRPNLHVVLQNVSATPLRIFDEWNSAGYFNLTLDYTLPDGSHQQMSKKNPGGWRMNSLSATTLQPGQCLVRDVYFDAKWTGVPKLSKQATLTFTATFTEKNLGPGGVWHGTIQSPPMQVVVKADH